jgi:hypothetical protein
MKILKIKYIIVLVLITLASAGSCNAQIFHRNASKKVEKGMFGKTLGNKKEARVKEPRSVVRSKKEQENNKKKLDKEYEKFVRESKKRSYDIQTPEVQARMKQNAKDAEERDKARKKNSRYITKKGGKKYK